VVQTLLELHTGDVHNYRVLEYLLQFLLKGFFGQFPNELGVYRVIYHLYFVGIYKKGPYEVLFNRLGNRHYLIVSLQ